jgi:sugar lactone lactonase YvrE
MRAEQITDPVAHHGEGPVWSADGVVEVPVPQVTACTFGGERPAPCSRPSPGV